MALPNPMTAGLAPTRMDIMTQGFNIYTGSNTDDSIRIGHVDFDAMGVIEAAAGISGVLLPDGFTDIELDNADLFAFTTSSFELPQLTIFRSLPSETLRQEDALPLTPGVHHLEVASITR